MNLLESCSIRLKAGVQNVMPNMSEPIHSMYLRVLDPFLHVSSIEIHEMNYSRIFISIFTSTRQINHFDSNNNQYKKNS